MSFEIFLMAPPGLEPALAEEVRQIGLPAPQVTPGGVTFRGDWPDVWRANLHLRGAGRVMAKLGEFRAFHLAQLDKRAHKFPWAEVLRSDVPLKVEVTTRKSKIYHAGAAQERIETALRDVLGVQIAKDAPVTIRARIDDDMVVFSVDTSGEPLHKRGHKQAVGKAPMRETMAAMFLRSCGFTGAEPVLDPMCGSGTFVLEAAEIAAGLLPGRGRGFAFEHLKTFDAEAWAGMRRVKQPALPDLRFYGSDRNAGAFAAATANAERAGIADLIQLDKRAISDIRPPDGPPGLVIANPPYGTRIGDKKGLYQLHGAFGRVLMDHFEGWRVGIVTTDGGLAKATGLPFGEPGPQIPHGGLRVRLFQTGPLPRG